MLQQNKIPKNALSEKIAKPLIYHLAGAPWYKLCSCSGGCVIDSPASYIKANLWQW